VECQASGYAPDDAWQASLRGLAEPDGSGFIHLHVIPDSDYREPAPLGSEGPVAPATDEQLAPEQFADTHAFTTEGLVGDDDEPRVWASAAGGGDLRAIGIPGDPSYVLIERCND
jgi:hypothetical protein